MDVKLVSYTPNGDVLCAAAAKLCHESDEKTFEEILEEMENDYDYRKRLIKYILRKEHLSILEHASYTFIITGISRVTSHQLVRHRMASYSQQSQRYVRFKDLKYVVPPAISEDPDLSVKYDDIINAIENFYLTAINDKKIKPEDARYLFPNAGTTKILVTMNARELRHFFSLRLHPTAQWEIREMAHKMYIEVLKVAPLLFEDIEVV